MSDVIGPDYMLFPEGVSIIFDADKGCGKTYFVTNVLAPYAIKSHRRMLYLCNRVWLYNDLFPELGLADDEKKAIDLRTYQKFQGDIAKGEDFSFYDYVILDECHYFLDDSLVNERTNEALDYILDKCKKSIKIYISATGQKSFKLLRRKVKIEDKYVYSLERHYDYVDNAYTFTTNDTVMTKDGEVVRSNAFIRLITQIQRDFPDDKILIFVHKMEMLDALHKLLGNKADYICSKSQANGRKFISDNCIKNNQFSKQILVSTSVLYNGVSLKDRQLKHIIIDLFGLNAVSQALGRKREINANDTCNFYIRSYSKGHINSFKNSIDIEIKNIEEYKADPENFWGTPAKGVSGRKKPGTRGFRAFYVGSDGKAHLNELIYEKFLDDREDMQKFTAKGSSYLSVLFAFLGEELNAKQEWIKPDKYISSEQKKKLETLTSYLERNCKKERRFYGEEEKKALKSYISGKLGLKADNYQLKTINANLEENGVPFRIKSVKDKKTKYGHREERYWCISREEQKGGQP